MARLPLAGRQAGPRASPFWPCYECSRMLARFRGLSSGCVLLEESRVIGCGGGSSKRVDTQVRFDPDKFGWNWAPGTVSWVVPTALAILALRTAAKHNFGSAKSQRRIQLGIEMLLDRVCPGGGWNAGNGVAFGVALAPHVEATALALLALQKTKFSGHRLVQASLDWLVEQTRQCRGITSTAWAILALHAYQPALLSSGRGWRV